MKRILLAPLLVAATATGAVAGGRAGGAAHAGVPPPTGAAGADSEAWRNGGEATRDSRDPGYARATW
jgi:hypothetical protein